MSKKSTYLRLAEVIAEQLEKEFDPIYINDADTQSIIGELMTFEHQLEDVGSWLIQIDDGVGMFENVAHLYCKYGDALGVAAVLFPEVGKEHTVRTDALRVAPVVSAIATFDEVK